MAEVLVSAEHGDEVVGNDAVVAPAFDAQPTGEQRDVSSTKSRVGDQIEGIPHEEGLADEQRRKRFGIHADRIAEEPDPAQNLSTGVVPGAVGHVM
ncbi:hypothetical protein AX769_11760 [Frondihabitans sp. PAMC 28766]|nr:hypothetical protein AX769_11760 [Frondihabitans sp. PAMC 28766]